MHTLRISGRKWGDVATLPASCRPAKRLIFNLNNHQYTSRVDVLTNGQIRWIASGNSGNSTFAIVTVIHESG